MEYQIVSNKKRSFFDSISLTLKLIIINVIIFFIFLIGYAINKNFIDYLVLKPSSILAGKYLWTLLTSMFVHAEFFHLFANMFSLFFIGTLVEKLIGRKRFLWFYIISGVFANLFFVALSLMFGNSVIGAKIFSDPNIYALGASGAIFGLAGILAVIVPKQKVYLIVGPLLVIIVDSIIPQSFQFVSVILNLLILFMLFAMFSFNPKMRKIAIPLELSMWQLPIVAIVPLIIIGLFVALPIGNTAHLGGLIAGLVYGLYLRKKYKKKVKMLSRMFK